MRLHAATLLALLLALAATSARAVDVNEATLAQLEQLKGVGPSLAEKVMAQRQRQRFADWRDFIRRVPGLGPASAAKLSAAGLTVNGLPLTGRNAGAASAAADSR